MDNKDASIEKFYTPPKEEPGASGISLLSRAEAEQEIHMGLHEVMIEEELTPERREPQYRNDPLLLKRLQIAEQELGIKGDQRPDNNRLLQEVLRLRCKIENTEFRHDQLQTSTNILRQKEVERKGSLDRLRTAYYKSDWDRRYHLMQDQACQCGASDRGRPRLNEQLRKLLDALEMELVGTPGRCAEWADPGEECRD
jgi:hypothetical protein